jgi:hypothetical protein
MALLFHHHQVIPLKALYCTAHPTGILYLIDILFDVLLVPVRANLQRLKDPAASTPDDPPD